MIKDILSVWKDKLPGDVHTAFIDAGIIPEPLHDRNDECCRFLEDQEFWYRRVFTLDENELSVAEWFRREDIPDNATISLTGTMMKAFKEGLV